MKRDFSQPFTEVGYTRFYILAEDSASGKLLVIRSFDEDKVNEGFYNEEFYHLPYLDVSRQGDIAQQLTRVLYSQGLILDTFREIASETTVNYSFADDTPGEKQYKVAIHAIVDLANPAYRGRVGGKEAQFVLLSELYSMPDISSGPRVIALGIARLRLERDLGSRNS